MTDAQRRSAAKQFVADWTGRGDEKQETQAFWRTLLQKVFGVEEPDKFIAFEMPVKLNHTSFIDGYIASTSVLIEQKGWDINLQKGYKQSDGSILSPFQQARRYAGYLPHNQNPRWIVVCNFQEFHIHDMNRPNDAPEVVALADLEKEYNRLQFLVDTGDETIKKEMAVSLKVGELVGILYDALLQQYKNPNDPETLKSLNALCVRLVFCLYAEDAGIFGGHKRFRNYLQNHKSEDRRALINLFRVLDQKPEERDAYMDEDLAAFPYVNGGLFANENIEIPRLGEEIITLLTEKASENFDWSAISPTIFGAVFESTLNPETRRSGGMHYTSIENIHKVIDPLFLDGLKAELEEIKGIAVERTRDAKLRGFQNKLAGLKFLDPACGSGNFLTETYLSLRRLENEVLSVLHQGQIVMDVGNPIQVSIGQFYGIEINDFAVTVAKTALWIAESQMMKETEDVVHMSLDFLPLKSYANIVEGNALRLDWESVVPKHELHYIMGNPPFVGKSYQTPEQKSDMEAIFCGIKNYGNLDYVTCWHKKSVDLMENTNIRCALVSTNSICQGIAVPPLWRYIFEEKGAHIDFAHRTFRWNSEASAKAQVHCVIIGFSVAPNKEPRLLFTSDRPQKAENINAYLLDAPNVIIDDTHDPVSDVPKMAVGSFPTDDGNLVIQNNEYEVFIQAEPIAKKYIRLYLGPLELINAKKRYCLWLKDCPPNELRQMPMVMDRIQNVRQYRSESKKAQTRKRADIPHLFAEDRQPSSDYIMIPRTSSEQRRYMPMGFFSADVIAGDTIILPDATIYHFGILTSNIHMAWMRAVCGPLKSDYRYSNTIVYNNFPFPVPTHAQRAKIEQTAQAILDARALYPDCSLADLYDETTMPSELRKAHQQNDRAVWEAYGKAWDIKSESACVAELMRMYQKLIEIHKK